MGSTAAPSPFKYRLEKKTKMPVIKQTRHCLQTLPWNILHCVLNDTREHWRLRYSTQVGTNRNYPHSPGTDSALTAASPQHRHYSCTFNFTRRKRISSTSGQSKGDSMSLKRLSHGHTGNLQQDRGYDRRLVTMVHAGSGKGPPLQQWWKGTCTNFWDTNTERD